MGRCDFIQLGFSVMYETGLSDFLSSSSSHCLLLHLNLSPPFRGVSWLLRESRVLFFLRTGLNLLLPATSSLVTCCCNVVCPSEGWVGGQLGGGGEGGGRCVEEGKWIGSLSVCTPLSLLLFSFLSIIGRCRWCGGGDEIGGVLVVVLAGCHALSLICDGCSLCWPPPTTPPPPPPPSSPLPPPPTLLPKRWFWWSRIGEKVEEFLVGWPTLETDTLK